MYKHQIENAETHKHTYCTETHTHTHIKSLTITQIIKPLTVVQHEFPKDEIRCTMLNTQLTPLRFRVQISTDYGLCAYRT